MNASLVGCHNKAMWGPNSWVVTGKVGVQTCVQVSSREILVIWSRLEGEVCINVHWLH